MKFPNNTLLASTPQSKKIIVLTCTILAFAVMNGTMFNVAIPDISDSFNLTPSQVSWVITSFTTVFAIGTLIYGKLSDFFPIRSLYTIGLSLFSLGSLVGFLSPNYETLIVGRVLQAMGAASVPPSLFLSRFDFFKMKKEKCLDTWPPRLLFLRELALLSAVLSVVYWIGAIFSSFP